MRAITAGILALALLLVARPAAAEGCDPGLPDTSDLAGVYLAAEDAIMVRVYACGGVGVLWSDERGTHEAWYTTAERMPDGTLLTRVYQPDRFAGTLHGRRGFAFKPAEPGYVQVILVGPFADHLTVYRLAKVG